MAEDVTGEHHLVSVSQRGRQGGRAAGPWAGPAGEEGLDRGEMGWRGFISSVLKHFI